MKANQFLDELLKCKQCRTEDEGKTWIFCKKHWKILKETNWLKDEWTS